MIKKHCLFLILTFVTYITGYSQSIDTGYIKNQLSRINHYYDSAQFLSFDVDIKYNTDTVYGSFESDRELANYVINGGNLYYHIGAIEYMQNDSFSITADNTEKMLFITKEAVQKNSSLFPLKEFSDSVLAYYFNYYSVTVTDTGDDKVIRFTSDSINLPYKEVAIYYDSAHFTLSRIEMTFMQAPTPDDLPDSIPINNFQADLIGKHIVMQFSNYKFIENTDMFKDDQYFYFDRRRKEYSAVGKYNGYRLITSNLENAGKEYDDIEVQATPENNQQ